MTDPVTLVSETLLSDAWTPLRQVTFEQRRRDGRIETLTREVYDRGNAAAVLPYDPERRMLLLARQFRLPPYLQGVEDGMIEACAGVLDGEDPETCVRREAEEELGYRLRGVEPVFAAFMSPGSVSEKVFGFLAPYGPQDRTGDGGGHPHEGEDIEVLELAYDDAFARLDAGEIADGKTIILLQALRLRG
jgi:nudix-type nucleoside diphosphatase (YffH/AdpP family)